MPKHIQITGEKCLSCSKKERRRTKYFAMPLITEPLNVLVLICFGLLGHSNNFVCMNSNDNKKSIFQQI